MISAAHLERKNTQEEPNISFPKLVFSDETPIEEINCNLVQSTLAHSNEQQNVTLLEPNLNNIPHAGQLSNNSVEVCVLELLDSCPACGKEIKSLMRQLKKMQGHTRRISC